MKKLYASLLSLSSFFLCSPLTSKAEILSMEVLDSLSQRQKATSIRELREAQAAADAAAATISGLDNLPIYMDVDPGEISYQSGVSPSGAKTYSVPIFTAPSVGAKPAIALSYNSQSIAGGIAGVGWNLAGASSINLVSKTLFFDNDVCAIDFSSPNKYAYALDGDRLLTNPSDPIATEYPYMTRNGRVRVKPIFNGNALLYFIALLPDGAKATFGFMDNTKTRASYPITSYTDSRGYRIDFSYELSRNIYYLAQIAYGGKAAGNLSNSIVFEYTQRLDSLTHYISGEAYTTDKLLKKIHSFGHGKLLRTYTLAHEYSRGKTQLHRISCLVGQHQLPPLSFVYGFDTPQNSESIVESGGMFPVTTYIGTETVRIKGRFLKGSPLEGFISFPPKPPYQAYNDNGTIWGSGMSATQEFGFIAHSEASFAPLSITAGEGFQNITAADVDGDGTDEVVKINMNTIYPFAESVVIDVSIYKYDEKTHSLQSSTCSFLISNGGGIRAQPTNFNFISYQWGDVTGDGAIDLICVSSSKTVTGEEKGSYWNLIDIKNNKKLFTKRWNDINYFSNQGGGYSTLDFDGDGKFEIEYWDKNFTRSLYLWDNEIKDFVLIKSGKFSVPFMGVNVNGDAYCDRIEGPMLSYQYDPDQVPDIRDLATQTSDETVYKERDLVFHDGGNIWTILLYNGTDFEKKEIELIRIMKNDKVYFHDVNRDGLSDIVMTKTYAGLKEDPKTQGIKDDTPSSLLYVFLNRNGSFSFDDKIVYQSESELGKLIPFNALSPGGVNQLIAINDGIARVFEINCDEQTRHLITGVQSSTGLIETNEYAAPTSGYTFSGYTFPPLPDGYNYLSFPLKTVSKVSKGIKGEPHRELTEYTFSDGVINRHGLGFCGFKETKTYASWDYAFGDGVETVTLYDPLQQGVPLSSTTRIGFNSSDKIKASSFIYQSNGQTGPWKKPLLISSQESDLLNNTTLSRTYTYDSEDFPVKTTEDNGEGVQTITEQTYRHIKQSNSYRLGLPLTKTTTYKRNGNRWMQKETIAYNAALLPISIISFTGENGTLKTGEIRREYDDAGNMTAEKSAPYDATDFRGKTYTYDDKGRLASETDIFGQKTVYEEYDAYGHPCLIRDDRGNEVRTVYDVWGNIASIRNADGSKEEYSRQLLTSGYPRNLQVITSTNDGGKTLAEYDAYGREVKTGMLRFDGSWLYTAKEYTAAGMLKRESLPFKGNTPLHWNTCEYDRYKRPVKQTMASGAVQTWAYTPRRVSETKEAITTTRVSDASGLLESVSDPGGEITYHYRPDGQPSEIKAPGNVKTLFEYDQYGRQRAIIDPSAGRIEATETWTGRRRTTVRKDARKKVITSMYDEFGRLQKTVTPEFTTNYTYDKDLVKSAITTSGYSRTYDYDHLDRLIRTEETVEGKNLIEQLSYNTLGQLQDKTATLPTGATVTETYQYTRGTLTRKTLQDGNLIWQLLKENAMGLPTKVRTGSRTREYKYSTVGLPTERFTTGVGGFNYDFDPQTGNLLMRSDKNSGRYENFSYDGLNRLTGVAEHRPNGDLGIATLTSFSYTPNGNVTEISNIGKFIYSTQSPYRIVNMGLKMGAEAFADTTGQNISYASFDRPLTISGNGYTATLTYTDDYSRTTMTIRSPMLKDPFFKRTYIGNYEADSYGTQRKNIERYYIGGDAYSAPAVYVRVNSGQWKLHYIYRDYQGSVTDITDASGTVVHRMRYSPWGKLLHTDGTPYTRSEELSTDYDRLLFLGRGYTGHEYLPWFGLVNMNARLYDPAIGRFLSPDPYVQMPDFSQNFNRYSYCLNNPLVYVDENGEFIHLIIGAVVGGVANVISNWEMIKAKGFWTGLGYFGVGAAVGAGSAALGGWIAGVTQSAGIITGAAVGAGTGAVTGAASSVTLNGLNNVIGGQNFWNGWQQSAISGAIGGGISGGIAGGMKGYELAKEGGKNMWWGGDVKHGRTQWSFFTTEKPYETISWDIKNVGSKSLNDCVPTSFAEADDYFGGNTTYEQYKTTTNYQQDVGVMASNHPNAYGRVLSKQFTGAPMPDPVSVLADPQQVLSIKKSGNLIHTNMPHSGGMGHVDNLRSIKYYHSGKIVMNFRIGSYRLSSVNGNWWFYTLNGLKQL